MPVRFKPESEGGQYKPAGYEMDFSITDIEEIKKCRNGLEGLYYFVEKYCKIISKKGAVPFKLYEYQRRILRAYYENDRIVVAIARQMGKSLTAAAFIFWYACFHRDKLCLIASNKGRGAQEIITRIKFMYLNCPWFLKPGITKFNVFTIGFDNGTSIEGQGTTENTGRGLAIHLLYVDEYAHVSDRIAKALWTSVSPALTTSGGKWIITSTPKTDTDRFGKVWFSADPLPYSDKWEDPNVKESDQEIDEYETVYESEELRARKIQEIELDDDDEVEGFKRFFAHWTSMPGRDEKFKLKELKSGTTQTEWNTEFECWMAGSDDTLINSASIMSMVPRKPRLVDRHGVEWYHLPKPNTAYAIMLDPSEGKGGDLSAIQVWSIPDLRQVAEWATNQADQIEQTKMLIRIMKRIYDTQQNHPDHVGDSDIYYSTECNGVGMGIIQTILVEGEEKFPGYLIDSSGNKVRGMRTTPSSKFRYCMELKKLVERGIFRPSSKELIKEFKNFTSDGTTYKAKVGTDDRVMACVLMCHMLEELKYHEDGLEERMHVQLTSSGESDEDDGESGDHMPMGVFF